MGMRVLDQAPGDFALFPPLASPSTGMGGEGGKWTEVAARVSWWRGEELRGPVYLVGIVTGSAHGGKQRLGGLLNLGEAVLERGEALEVLLVGWLSHRFFFGHFQNFLVQPLCSRRRNRQFIICPYHDS
jgi:hypothetical protein